MERVREIDLVELKELQLQILKNVAEFCDKNSINYWLDSGTLLGAVRHKGYIPWDDDIDIGMLRPDYDKFLSLFNGESDVYKAYSVETNKDILYPFAKVFDTRTVLYEPDEKGVKSYVYVDLFVYDNAPDDDRLVKKLYRKRDWYRFLYNTRTRINFSKNKPFVHVIKILLYPFLSVFPKYYFCKKIALNSRRYADMECKRVGNFTAVTKMICDKDVFEEFFDVVFEDGMFKAPIGYDKWLQAFYGDYMTLPPEEKRVPHHKFKAFFYDKGDVL